MTITVTNTNRPPTLEAIGNQEAVEGTALAFTLSAIDLDGDHLTFAGTPLPSGATLDSDTGAFDWTPGDGAAVASPYVISFSVSDGEHSDSETISIVVMARASVALSTTLNPSALGADVTFTAIVTGSLDTPTGQVLFENDGLELGTVAVEEGTAILTTASLPVGTHPITAHYLGNDQYTPSLSMVMSQEVIEASDQSTQTQLTASPSAATLDEPVTLTANVSGGSGKTRPTGSVRFDDGAVTLGIVSLSPNRKATLVVTLGAGLHSLRATYLGDESFDPSASEVLNYSVSAATAAASMTLTSSQNPSFVGDSVTLTAVVTREIDLPSPTGTITFFDGNTPLATVGMTAGSASFTTVSLDSGNRKITAIYSGDDVYTSASASIRQNVRVKRK
jgi:large repetitive protein